MTDFVIECGEYYQKLFPWASWEQAMNEITSGSSMANYICKKVLERRGINADYI